MNLFARKFATTLKGGEILALIGELGAGKTVFTKGLAQGLGISGIVSSPTFLLMKCYKGKLSLCHVDAYRVDSPAELEYVGIGEYFGRKDAILVVEWADKVPELFEGRKHIEINFKHGKKEGERMVEIGKKS
jgi:tRNA threonylcarbamoyladenosine biosynthesis protein TsaE